MPPSRKCSSPYSVVATAGGSRPGTAALARIAGTSGPLMNQCSAARSMLAAQTPNVTGRSSKVRSPNSSTSRSRSGFAEKTCVPPVATTRRTVRSGRSRNSSLPSEARAARSMPTAR